VSLCAGLGVNAYLDFLTSAILTPKSNIADEALPTDSLTLKQKGEGVIRNSTAGTGQAQVGVALVLGLGNGSGSPVVLFHRARDHGPKLTPIARCWGVDHVGCLPLLGPPFGDTRRQDWPGKPDIAKATCFVDVALWGKKTAQRELAAIFLN